MHYRTAHSEPAPNQADPLERGQFGEGGHVFVVCASSLDAPDSFQVYTKGNRADVVLIVSGLSSGNLHATWSSEWRGFTPEWREWLRAGAFHVFYNGDTPMPIESAADPRAGKVRHCNG